MLPGRGPPYSKNLGRAPETANPQRMLDPPSGPQQIQPGEQRATLAVRGQLQQRTRYVPEAWPVYRTNGAAKTAQPSVQKVFVAAKKAKSAVAYVPNALPIRPL